MEKSGLNTPRETPEQELKRLRKENAKLKAQKEADKAKIKDLKKDFKKRRAEDNRDRRTTQVAFEPVPRHIRVWVTWARKMLGCLDSLDKELKEAYSFLLQYQELIGELGVCVDSVAYLETLCKCEGFGLRTNALCQQHIIVNLVGNANNKRVCVGLEMLDYFRGQAALINGSKQIHNISSDIM